MSEYEDLLAMICEKDQQIKMLLETSKQIQLSSDFYQEVNKSIDFSEITARAVAFLRQNLQIRYIAIYLLAEENLILNTVSYLTPQLLTTVSYEANRNEFENISIHTLLGDKMVTVPIFSQDRFTGIIAYDYADIGEQELLYQEDFWLHIGYSLGCVLEKGDLYKKVLMASQLKSLFVANLSHEIRTPLTAIIGFSELLGWETLNEKQLEYVDALQSSSNHLLSIIDNILDLSRIESDKIELNIELFSIEELIVEVEKIFKRVAMMKNISLTIVNQVPSGKELYSDKARLRQVLINLLGNALKFTERGQVRFVITEKDQGIVFAIHDTGIGIAKDKQKMIFESFSQADPSTTKKYGGTGLGLAISKKIVTLLGGELAVESVLGQGSCFFFALPNVAVLAVPETFESKKQAKMRVLLVDDNEMNRKIIHYMLEQEGYYLEEAYDGEMALAILQEKKFDLILMDLQMPKKDGYTATAELRALGFTVPILALSAYANSENRSKAFLAGCNDYLVKPLKKEELVAKMIKFLGKPNQQFHKEQDFLLLQKEFIASLAIRIAEIDQAFCQKDEETLKMIGHKLKGSGKMFGYPYISDLGAEIETLEVACDTILWAAIKEKLKKTCQF